MGCWKGKKEKGFGLMTGGPDEGGWLPDERNSHRSFGASRGKKNKKKRPPTPKKKNKKKQKRHTPQQTHKTGRSELGKTGVSPNETETGTFHRCPGIGEHVKGGGAPDKTVSG